MIYNATFIVTNQCNSRCTNCNIWKQTDYTRELSVEEIGKLFSLPELSHITELGISGGEAFLRHDLQQVIEKLLQVNPKIEKFYFTSNASIPDRVLSICELVYQYGKKMCLGVSIDGTREVNHQIRGVDSYDKAVSLIREVVTKYPEVDTQISFTICERNCKKEILEHIKELAHRLHCDYTFRIAETSEQYYHNKNVDNHLTEEQKKLVIDFILQNKTDDLFMQEALYYYITGKVPMMYDYRKKEITCGAGKDFVFIQSDGKIYPCLYSQECIGDINGMKKEKDKYTTSKCPCMTECTVWPMIIKYQKN